MQAGLRIEGHVEAVLRGHEKWAQLPKKHLVPAFGRQNTLFKILFQMKYSNGNGQITLIIYKTTQQDYEIF